MNPPTPFIFKTVLATWGSLRFHMSFEWIFTFLREKKCRQDFYTNCTKFIECFDGTDI